MKEVTAEAFYQKWQESPITVIDVREVDEFLEGHIEGSRNLPLSGLEQHYHQLDKGQEYYVICHSGKRSLAASEFLHQQGFDVTSVQGGVMQFPGELVVGEENETV